MRKILFGLTGFFLGMMFIVKSSSGYISILLPTQTPLIQRQGENLKSKGLLPAPTKKLNPSKNQPQKKQKASESYANQLSALRYVMRSA